MRNKMAEFTERFAEAAADSDYSAKPKLQGVSEFDIRAAGRALWHHWNATLNNGADLIEIDEPAVIEALSAQVRRYDDEGELVSVEFEEYWDATDAHNLPSGLLEEMKRELARGFLAKQREAGRIVVSDQDGIWIFDFARGRQ